MSDCYKGQFLVAVKQLRDPNFFRSVVLIVEHSEGGAMGLVVNRPSSVPVAHALVKHFNLPETEDLVYFGGPVEPTALFILHNAQELDMTESPVLPGLYVGSSADVFERIVRQAVEGDSELKYRIFSGCAGWAPDQLEGEVARGDWYLQPATSDLILYADPYDVWDRLLQTVYEANRILPHTPNDPEWN